MAKGKRLAVNLKQCNHFSKQNQRIKYQKVNLNPIIGVNNVRFFSPATAYAAVTEMEQTFHESTHQTYESFNNTDLTLESVLTQMQAMERQDMSFEDFQSFFPLADELVHYFEELHDESHQMTATQTLSLISFGSKFTISSMVFWDFVLQSIKSKPVQDSLSAIQTIKSMNAL